MNSYNKFLIVGLGNPGSEYANTRHNAGAWALAAISDVCNVSMKLEKKFYGQLAIVPGSRIDKIETFSNAGFSSTTFGFAHDTYLLIPATYMNTSGKAVAAIANYYSILPEFILIMHDDLDLPIGTIKLKDGGGHQGHNGLRDIVAALGTGDFKRLRIGIGRPEDKAAVPDYVLASPSKGEKQEIISAIDRALKVIPKIIAGDWQSAVNDLHSG